ncbi:hypothetical protein F1734_26045 (plasmid) [Rhodococcus ruber]|uniref:DUF6924 domain-containing protein n=1 Tax=Rhodococcus ruber TaxID=1830 RepID=UPI00111E7757|nr:hypothetical protein [Rhodococcus ruber]QDC17458.1 hypothetical protein E2561_25055 [Rhodococcus ruber]QRE83802.1 hypothetical protein F1734_26045 [Rhodococcus ruber]
MVTMDFPAAASLLVRLDYSDDEAWTETLRATGEPDPDTGYRAALTVVENPELDGMPVDELLEHLIGAKNFYSHVFVVDWYTLDHPEHPVLAIELPHGQRDAFGLRVVPSQMASVEANLATSNLDLEEYAEGADSDGIYRGTTSETPSRIPIRTEQVLAAMEHSPSTPALNEFRAVLEDGPSELEAWQANPQKWYEERSSHPASFYAQYWDVLGEEEFREALRTSETVLGMDVRISPITRWDVLLDPATFKPLAAARWTKRPPRSARRT